MKISRQMNDFSMEDMAAMLETQRRSEGGSASAQERLSHVMGIWGTTFNIMAAFAAPRVLAKLPEVHEMSSKQIIELFDEYIELITGEKSGEKFDGEDFYRTLEPTRRARALVEEWVASEEAPIRLVEAARDFFVSFGWAEPDVGWDAWEGPPEDSETRRPP